MLQFYPPLNSPFNPSRSPITATLRVFAVSLLTPWLFQDASAQSATTLRGVQTVFSRRAAGNAFFNRNLRSSLQARGLRFTRDPKRADAFLDTSGHGLRNGGFAGEMTLTGRGGRILLRERVVRPPASRTMAYQALAAKFRASKH